MANIIEMTVSLVKITSTTGSTANTAVEINHYTNIISFQRLIRQ